MKVFWAWQFDLPGKISRHFIRAALEDAIAQINQFEDIDEPDEAFQTGMLQLDYGRKDLKGSPDLALAILKKIETAVVFVGDVTPVGKGPPYTTDDGKKSDGKLLMNPNVAIELGYALKSLTTENVLMIMNNYYGKREDMPFDLGHKGGPILYKLAPDASKTEIEAEKKRLAAVLVEALREYVPKPVVEPFAELKPQIGQGLFFKDGEVLGENKNDRNKTKYVMPFRRVMWLRVMPNKTLAMPLSLQTLTHNIGRFGAFGAPVGMEPIRENAYGVAFFSPAGATDNINYISQYTRDGEVWGIHADILRQGEQGDTRYIYSLPMENLFITSLSLYVDFMQQVAKVPPPLQVEAGIEGIKGAKFAHHGRFVGDTGVMHHDRISHRGHLKRYDKSEQNEFVMEFFRKVHANTGVERPVGLYGRD